MDTYGITDPIELEKIRKEIKEQVYFQDLTSSIITQIAQQWMSVNEVHGEVKNKYYNFDYIIKDSWNQTGNRTVTFLNTGKTIHDYKWVDITHRVRVILTE